VRLVLEVIVQTVDDARAATDGGADRLEVVRAIEDGGLTPALPLVRAIAEATPLPLRVMLRENAGYETNAAELGVLQRAALAFHAMAVDGLVIGFARSGALRIEDLTSVLHVVPGSSVTFHRAFDSLADPLGAIDSLARTHAIDRILTSGGAGPPPERIERLRRYALRAGARPAILAGGGVDDAMIAAVAASGCVREVHVGRAAREGGTPEGPVSAARVRRLRAAADGR
jgi:copper homeostasis protein